MSWLLLFSKNARLAPGTPVEMLFEDEAFMLFEDGAYMLFE